jgi:hypothetical protein
MANRLYLALLLDSIWNSSVELVRPATAMGLPRDQSEVPDIYRYLKEKKGAQFSSQLLNLISQVRWYQNLQEWSERAIIPAHLPKCG